MVTKLRGLGDRKHFSLILAKNHMVTKHSNPSFRQIGSLILAKNHMVTKLTSCNQTV